MHLWKEISAWESSVLGESLKFISFPGEIIPLISSGRVHSTRATLRPYDEGASPGSVVKFTPLWILSSLGSSRTGKTKLWFRTIQLTTSLKVWFWSNEVQKSKNTRDIMRCLRKLTKPVTSFATLFWRLAQSLCALTDFSSWSSMRMRHGKIWVPCSWKLSVERKKPVFRKKKHDKEGTTEARVVDVWEAGVSGQFSRFESSAALLRRLLDSITGLGSSGLTVALSTSRWSFSMAALSTLKLRLKIRSEKLIFSSPLVTLSMNFSARTTLASTSVFRP